MCLAHFIQWWTKFGGPFFWNDSVSLTTVRVKPIQAQLRLAIYGPACVGLPRSIFEWSSVGTALHSLCEQLVHMVVLLPLQRLRNKVG